MLALVDCNNFYASCEQLFAPALRGRPVVVLSNNDGCVVARSAEAKALGIPMAVPWFSLREQAKREGIVALSSNYALYADMSNRVVEILSQFSPALEVYSIDESFLDLGALATTDRVAYGQEIRARIAQWVGLPVCVGIAPTKTLAKLANHIAKKRPAFGGVCDLERLDMASREALFASFPVSEVWGVGRRIEERLRQHRIETVLDLERANPDWIRRTFSVVLERTVRELNGVSCLSLEELTPPRQQIMASRSFGTLVEELDWLKEAVASCTSRAAEKLRGQRCRAGAITVMIRSNPFRPEQPQYQRSVTWPLVAPSADTRHLVSMAMGILEAIYRPGISYQKAGVTLSELVPDSVEQGCLFSEETSDVRSTALMRTLDAINRRWGRDTLRSSATGTRQDWQMRRERLSPAYTTAWEGIPSVRAI